MKGVKLATASIKAVTVRFQFSTISAVIKATSAIEPSDQNNSWTTISSKEVNMAKCDKFGRFYATGRRKTSSARVWIREGSGEFVVNDKPFIEYFQSLQREHILTSFLASKRAGYFDVWCTVKGGGMSGQAGAVRLGICRALEIVDPTLRPPMKRLGLMTRDSRRVERKKPGQKKARKKFQWVKR